VISVFAYSKGWDLAVRKLRKVRLNHNLGPGLAFSFDLESNVKKKRRSGS
jgi:hypothetical protein